MCYIEKSELASLKVLFDSVPQESQEKMLLHILFDRSPLYSRVDGASVPLRIKDLQHQMERVESEQKELSEQLETLTKAREFLCNHRLNKPPTSFS